MAGEHTIVYLSRGGRKVRSRKHIKNFTSQDWVDATIVLNNLCKMYGLEDHSKKTLAVVSKFHDGILSSQQKNGRAFLDIIKHFVYLEDKVNRVDWKKYERAMSKMVEEEEEDIPEQLNEVKYLPAEEIKLDNDNLDRSVEIAKKLKRLERSEKKERLIVDEEIAELEAAKEKLQSASFSF